MSGGDALPREPQDVAVLGAGPAGAAAALGLRRLGYRVAILGRPRANVIEGLSERTVAALAAAGLERAAGCAGRAVPRIGVWGGERAPRGREFPIARGAFDRALALDLAAAGLATAGCSVRAPAREDSLWRIDTDRGALRCRAVIEARGRQARGARRCGPRLVSWLTQWRVDPARAGGTAVVALEDGWCWLGVDAGLMQRQFVCSPHARLAARDLDARLEAAAAAVPGLDFSTRDAMPLDSPRAKAAAMCRARAAGAPGLLRIGDAALALDPLSGQGVHEALGSARIAAAAIRTFLDGEDWGPVARFVEDRTAELWRRGLDTAAGFYGLQARSAGAGAFWRSTAAEYARLAAEAAAETADPRPGRLETRPVLNGARIELRTVWVSPRWPRGVWRIARPAAATPRPAGGATTK